MSGTAPPAISLLPLGALIQTFPIGPKNTNIVLGFPAQEDYVKHNAPHFGLTIGRYANRIADGKINALGAEGKSVQLDASAGGHCLHGGKEGWGRKVWQGPSPVGIRAIPGIETQSWSALSGGESVKFTYHSAHLEENFPGTVEMSVIYTSGTQTKKDGKVATILAMEYEAVLVEDGSGVEETAVNLTNHSYFNLNPVPAVGQPISLSGTSVTLHTQKHHPLSSTGIPISTQAVDFPGVKSGEPFTFTQSRPHIDDAFLVEGYPTQKFKIDTREEDLKVHVTASHPDTKLNLEVLSTEPAFQFYSGIFVDVPAITSATGETVPARQPLSGFCVEPSRYVNAINVPEWKDQVVLKKGEKYGARIVYRGWSDE